VTFGNQGEGFGMVGMREFFFFKGVEMGLGCGGWAFGGGCGGGGVQLSLII